MSPLFLPDFLIDPVVRSTLAEDLGRAGDVSAALIDPEAMLTAVFSPRKEGRVAGVACARLAVAALDPAATFEILAPDGADVSAGAPIARVSANARALLSAERTALNLLCRLCGVATLTRAYVRAVEGDQALRSSTRERRRRDCGRSKSTPSGAAAERTTASAWMTQS